jgi:hypothetical protein
MSLSLQDLNNNDTVFKEIQKTMGGKRNWKVADLHFIKPSHEALSGYDTTKQFTIALGKSNGITIPLTLVVPLEVAEHGLKERRIPAGTIADK